MRLKLHQIVQQQDFSPYQSRLSEEGKKSISYRIVANYYSIARDHYCSVDESLRRYRDANGSASRGHASMLKPTNYRLETELTSLVTELLFKLPNLESIIQDDPQTSDEDKRILLEAFNTFKSKIDGLFKLLDYSCFAVKKEDE